MPAVGCRVKAEKLCMLFNLWDLDGDESISFRELALGLRGFHHLHDLAEAANSAREALRNSTVEGSSDVMEVPLPLPMKSCRASSARQTQSHHRVHHGREQAQLIQCARASQDDKLDRDEFAAFVDGLVKMLDVDFDSVAQLLVLQASFGTGLGPSRAVIVHGDRKNRMQLRATDEIDGSACRRHYGTGRRTRGDGGGGEREARERDGCSG
eukprot:scaffold2480_cov385-Prasinococcus_capsulatus_cf.AAC.11